MNCKYIYIYINLIVKPEQGGKKLCEMTIKDTRAVKHDVSRKPLATSANRR